MMYGIFGVVFEIEIHFVTTLEGAHHLHVDGCRRRRFYWRGRCEHTSRKGRWPRRHARQAGCRAGGSSCAEFGGGEVRAGGRGRNGDGGSHRGKVTATLHGSSGWTVSVLGID